MQTLTKKRWHNYTIIKVDFKARSIISDMEAHFKTIKGSSSKGRHNHWKLYIPNVFDYTYNPKGEKK